MVVPVSLSGHALPYCPSCILLDNGFEEFYEEHKDKCVGPEHMAFRMMLQSFFDAGSCHAMGKSLVRIKNDAVETKFGVGQFCSWLDEEDVRQEGTVRGVGKTEVVVIDRDGFEWELKKSEVNVR